MKYQQLNVFMTTVMATAFATVMFAPPALAVQPEDIQDEQAAAAVEEQGDEQAYDEQTPETSQDTSWLGVRVAVGPSAGERGVVVTRVFPASPAQAAGMEAGDAILRVGKTRVEAAADLQVIIAGRQPGDRVRMVVRRQGKRKEVDVQLGSFGDWHRNISQLTTKQLRQLVRQIIKAPLELDDLESQPAGDAGPRVAIGVIGIAQPAKKRTN